MPHTLYIETKLLATKHTANIKLVIHFVFEVNQLTANSTYRDMPLCHACFHVLLSGKYSLFLNN